MITAQDNDVPYVGNKPAILLPPKGKLPKAEDRKVVEPVVGPNGEFQEPVIGWTHARTGEFTPAHGGRCLVRIVEGQSILTAYAREQGFTLYRDICFGAVPGVEASPKHWRIYQLLHKSREVGRLPTRDALQPAKIYHPEVMRRRSGRAGGYERYSEAEFEASLAEFEASYSDEDRAQIIARAKDLGIPTPSDNEDAELEDLLELEKSKKGKR